jgi:hypothetical protein
VPIKTVCAACIHGKEMRRGRRYPITKRQDKRVPECHSFGRVAAQCKRKRGRDLGQSLGERELLKRVKEFQPKETKFTQKTQSAHFGHDRRSFAGYKA